MEFPAWLRVPWLAIVEDAMPSLGERLKAHWMAQGITLAGCGVPEEDLRAFEANRGVRLPSDLRDYLAFVDGMAGEEGWSGRESCWMDRDLFTFWSLKDFICCGDGRYLEADVAEPHSYYLFADHSIILPAFAIRITPKRDKDNIVLATTCDNRQYHTWVVADSFTEFVEMYLSGEDSRCELGVGISRRNTGTIPRNPPGQSAPSHPLWDREIDG
jgi:hypothetical protein